MRSFLDDIYERKLFLFFESLSPYTPYAMIISKVLPYGSFPKNFLRIYSQTIIPVKNLHSVHIIPVKNLHSVHIIHVKNLHKP